MREFEIGVVEISYGFVRINANSEDEAKKLARNEAIQGKAFWTSAETYIEDNVIITEKNERGN